MHKNNFDFLRLLFAVFVIISHSYPLSGLPENDWLSQISNYQVSFSSIGLMGFFSISGYLIYQSLERSKTLRDYYWKRVLRIFPGLFVVLLLTTILGVFVYNSDWHSYIKNTSVYTYLINNLSLFNLQFGINGIFENNPYKSAINGSLYTLAYEFTFYILLSFLFFFNGKIKKTIVLLIFVAMFIPWLFYRKELSKYGFILTADKFMLFGLSFVVGSLLAAIKFQSISHAYKIGLLVISILLAVISVYCGYYEKFQTILLPFIIITIGSFSWKYINTIGSSLGDISYGMYIYAFPVQQTLMHFFWLNHLQLMGFAILITVVLAWLSWHIIEKKALTLKKATAGRK